MRVGSEPEDKGATQGSARTSAGAIVTNSGGVLVTTDRNYITVKADATAADAAIVVGGSVATGEVSNAHSTVYDASGVYRALVTTGVSGNFAGWNNGGANGPQILPVTEFTAHLKTDADITDVRFWIALADVDITATSNPSTNNVLGFRYATDLDGTAFWRTYGAGGGSAATPVITPVAVIANTDYYFRVTQLAATAYRLSVNGIAADYFASAVGILGVRLGWTMGVTTLANVAKTVKCGFFTIDHK